jgi:hypothetical protein
MPYVLLLAESLPARRLPEQGEGEAALFENLLATTAARAEARGTFPYFYRL